jgi:hypothetical protein
MKNQCKCCGGKFGLVRYYHWRQAFCSKACLMRFEREIERKVQVAKERFVLTSSSTNAPLAHARIAKSR